MKPTLQTVADAVGVSRSTVSNAYGRPDQLSPELRERILSAARQLGYAGPDPTARSLRRGRAGAIGVLLAPGVSYAFTDPYAVEFMRGLTETAERHETGVLLVPLRNDDEDVLATVQSAAVDGFCVYCVPGWFRALEAVWARGLPVINSSDPGSANPNSLFVGVDEAAATRELGRHLIALGHRRIALIGTDLEEGRPAGPVAAETAGDSASYVSRERLRGFRDAFAEAGLAWSDVVVINAGGNSRQDGTVAATYVLDRAPRPTAVAAVTDMLALGILDALAARGLRAGQDVSVTGFDDIPDAAVAGLTTINQSAIERGRIAAELLLDPPSDPAKRHVVLPSELIVRTSTGPAQEGNM